jgi:phosphoserine phosphatase RsbU/P
VTLGTSILLAYLATYVVRRGFEKVFVLTAPVMAQPTRQFLLEMILGVTAGSLVMAYNKHAFNFPFATGLPLILGFVMFSFFFGMDMALQRERIVIRDTIEAHRAVSPGRLSSITRRMALVAVGTATVVVIILFLVISKDLTWLMGQNGSPIAEAQEAVAEEVLFIMLVLLGLQVNLAISYSKNLNLLFRNETGVLERVTRGDLTRFVPVATRDEFGVIAGHTNMMIEGLRHRLSLMSSIEVAKEVQQNLLPKKAPEFPGLDVSGISRYCEETGGDYFDYFTLPGNRFAAIVADASDHGVGSALYMAMARAFVTSRIQDMTDPADLMGRLNTFLEKDSEDGRFMTAFFLEIDPGKQRIGWVRAGHDPAFFFNPETQAFEMLAGKGMALGVDDQWIYTTRYMDRWVKGGLLLIGTDGIWESQDPDGHFFGKRRLRALIRENAHRSAEGIRDAVLEAVTEFRENTPLQDDITLVVIKFET